MLLKHYGISGVNTLKQKHDSLYTNITAMPTRFCIRDTRCCTYVLFTDIVRFEGSNNYTRVYLKNKQSRLLCSSLCRQYEKVKGTGLFFRIHKSHVINIEYVIHIFNNGTVVLSDGTELPCNPGEKEELIELMEK